MLAFLCINLVTNLLLVSLKRLSILLSAYSVLMLQKSTYPKLQVVNSPEKKSINFKLNTPSKVAKICVRYGSKYGQITGAFPVEYGFFRI